MLCASVILIFAAPSRGDGDAATAPAFSIEIYFLIGEIPVWMGDKIGYTVYETTQVEARFLSAAGEIILIYREGERVPGQYVLPWDGTAEGSPFGGYYTFELYFGDEYAAAYTIIVNPIFQAS